MLMVLNRDDVFVTDAGLSFRFVKGAPTSVPARFAAAAMRFGASAVDEAEPESAAVLAGIERAAEDEANRDPTIEAAIRKLVARNQSGDFTAGGKPNLNTLARLVGFTVGADEMAPLWKKISDELK